MRRWSDLINYSAMAFDKVSFRELIYKEKDPLKLNQMKKNLEKKLEEFFLKTKSKKYRIPCYIICCPMKKPFEKVNEWEKSKGYFCSQLCAAFYMNSGVIVNDKSCSSFLPGSFSHTSSIPFTNDFTMGPEIILDITKN